MMEVKHLKFVTTV